MLGVSSILCIVTCAMAMKQYVKGNITLDAVSSVNYFSKLIAQVNETVLFMFLGLSTVSSTDHVDPWFILATILSALVFRAIGVIAQCFILNRYRQYNFTFVDQFILSYGGLRGAIAYGLAMSLPHKINPNTKDMFITTNIALIYFTVFVQGLTIRPIVNWLKVEKQSKKQETFFNNVFNRTFDYTLAGVEAVMGEMGQNSIRDCFERINAKFLKPLFTRRCRSSPVDASHLVNAYNKVMLYEAMQSVIPMKKISTISANKITRMAWEDHERKLSQRHDQEELNTIISFYLASDENCERLKELFEKWLEEKLQDNAYKTIKMSANEAQELVSALKKSNASNNKDINIHGIV
uniref:Cation/H+ exchanger domain-containing protein n=1 Tax=Acrobeloides nanus TaxID=290746 RepID=A0A914BWD8_9BILA